ncbi:hypothetical protein SAMN05421505_112102 [Sinosporangium album]|uniref:Uncharacterized protein n=1 Tax=Sinosporangium album TaxID=504805 RepID=A0A1G8ACH4_9ACTN|nr:hypothetical protein [Sinosporangium album]SDH18664.1 hypothetical protein SAMN05421505_112102 [Sinosporangium album]
MRLFPGGQQELAGEIRGRAITLVEGRNHIHISDQDYDPDSVAYYHIQADGVRVGTVQFTYRPDYEIEQDVHYTWLATLYLLRFGSVPVGPVDYDPARTPQEFRRTVEGFVHRLHYKAGETTFPRPQWVEG